MVLFQFCSIPCPILGKRARNFALEHFMDAFEILDNPEIPKEVHGKFPLLVALGWDGFLSRGIFPSFSSRFKLKLLKKGKS